MLERYLGKEVLLQEALEHLVPQLLNQAISEQGIEPIAQPDVEIIRVDPVAFKATGFLSSILRCLCPYCHYRGKAKKITKNRSGLQMSSLFINCLFALEPFATLMVGNPTART
jgi:hypothetical protein